VNNNNQVELIEVLVTAHRYRVEAAKRAYDESRSDKGALIRMVRDALEMSIYEFAEALGVGQPYISKLENNRVPLSLALLKRLEQLLGTREQ